MQLSSGLVGALIVDGAIDRVPAVAAAVGQLTVVYWINQPTLTLGVLDIVWIG